jgi:hypothetical protein
MKPTPLYKINNGKIMFKTGNKMLDLLKKSYIINFNECYIMGIDV